MQLRNHNLSMRNIVPTATRGSTATGVSTHPGVFTASGVSTHPDKPQLSSNIVMVAGVAVSVVVVVFAAVCILVLVVWWR